MEINVGYKPSKLHVWLLALIFIPVGMAIFGLWFFKIEPFYGWTSPLITPVVLGSQGIGSTFIPAITDYVAKNPLAILTAAISIGGVVGGKLWTDHVNNEKVQLANQAQQAITDNTSLSKAYEKLQLENASLKSQFQNVQTPDFEGLLSERDTIISQQNDQIKNLQGQLQGLQTQLLLEKTKVVEKTVVK
jgi:hypothetical protein